MSGLADQLRTLSPAKRALLIEALRKQARQDEAGEAVPRRAHDGPAALSAAQQRLWVLEEMDPGTARYNMGGALRLTGTLSLPVLEQALGEVVRRHESLRTVFAVSGGEPVQVVLPPAPVHIPVDDVSALAADEREAAMLRIAGDEGELPFDLARGPLFRTRAVRLAPGEHVLVITMHHAVTDGWSMGVFFRELSALYDAFSRGAPSPLPGLSLQYADFAEWQRERLRGEAFEAQLRWWTEALAGVPSVLALPTDRPRPAVQGFRGGHRTLRLDAPLRRAVEELARAEGATPFMVLLAALDVVLARWSGQEDLVVGSPIANRTRPELEGIIGFFVNTLALRADLRGDPTFRALLARVRETTLDAYAHQEVPFERLVETLRVDRALSHTPLFQVMFALQNAPREPLVLPGLTIAPMELDTRTTKFDLTLFGWEEGDSLFFWLEYNAGIFDGQTAERLLSHLRTVLRAATEAPDRPLSALPLMDPAEHAWVVNACNDTARGYPAASGAHRLFEAQAALTPDAVAVSFEGAELTYAELDRRANRLAHRLRALGVGPDERVGVAMERSLEMPVALLAILKAGGALVALDAAYPQERLAYMVADASLRVLLTNEALAGRVEGLGAPVLRLDPGAGTDGDDDGPPAVAVHGGNLMYAIYTSGSTGAPKAIGVPHSAFTNLVRWQCSDSPLGSPARTLQFATFGFCVSFQEFFTSWAQGGTVVLVSDARRRDLEALRQVVRGERIERLYLPFAALKHLAETPGDEGPLPLRDVITAGEPLQVTETVRGFFGGLGGCALHNHYGASETHVVAALTLCGDPAGWPVIPAAGHAVGNARLYVLDRHGRPQPVGVPGELYVGGDALPRGYLDDPALTAAKLVPDPFGSAPGGRLYRTGDLARRLIDGSIEVAGRVDHQVKIRGFRVETGEVEAALRLHPGVRDAAVVPVDGEGGKRLVAYVAPVGSGPSAAELREHLRARLPDHMIPGAFAMLERLPVNANGKLDFAALPVPAEEAGPALGGAPRTPAEEIVAGVWAGVLGREGIGIHDNFFELGGHSLLATRVVARMRAALGVELPLRALFAHPTVAGLVEEMERMRRDPGAPVLPPVRPADRATPPPLSFAQQRLWFLDQYEQGSALYNVPASVRLRGALDAAALERALGEVVRRHESLRTVFRVDDGEPVQVILPAPDAWHLPVVDLSAHDADERESAVQRLAMEDAERPFDLGQGPLFRAALLRLGDDDHALLVCMHHAVSDGWSMGVLFRELSALYDAFVRGEQSPLADLPVQYADFAVWQREHLRGQALDAQVEYWRARLSGAPMLLELPSDRPRAVAQSYRGAAHEAVFPPALRDALQALARGEGATLYMVLLAAFQVLLSKYARQEDVVVGSPIAGRTRAEVEGLIGFFVNTLALRTDLSGDPSFREVLARVRETTLDAYAHQDLPFEKLVEELNPERSLSHSPIFQVLFALQNNAGGGLRLEGVQAERVGAEPGIAKFDLSLYMAETEDGLRCALEYATDLFDASTAERMLSHLGVLLDAVAADPARRIGRLPLLAAEERAQVLDAWNDTAADYPRESTLHALFEEQAARTPDSVAVVHAAGELTYAELDARANRLANHLRGLGVGAETRVAICVDRGAEMMVALLGVMKAGAAYVPLDPSYPAERLAFVLSDASVPVLLTQAHLEENLPDHGARVVRLDADWDQIARSSADAPRVDVGPDSAAYVIYTSGSTGRPKGVVVQHGSVVNFLHSMQREPGLSSGDTLLALTTLSFDIAGLELYLPLITGARVLLATQDEARDPTLLREKIASANVIQATPATWRMLLASGWTPDAHLKLLCGGEALPRELADQLLATGAEVWNLYGPTEATIWATAHRVGGGEETTVSIGRPIANTRVYILDAAGEPTPVGVPGELLIGGVQVARGYLNRPALTADRFIPDPFGAEPGGRLYRTGDLARWTERTDALTHSRTHALEFLRRLDFQVKVRGFRIELGEIESVLSRDPAVRESVVIVREDTPGDARLVAYVVADEGTDASALRERLRDRLPEYMVPSAVVVLDALPLTPNGKVDRKALPAPEAGAGQTEYAEPRTPTEREIAEIWAQVLGVERVGADDNFFALGGHSLLATRVVSRLRQTLNAEVPLRALFSRPTVRSLAGEVDAARGSADATPPLVPAGRDAPLPLSFAQQRLWFLDRLEPGSAMYNVPAAIRLRGALDAPALERALGEIVRRHESLRTVFRMDHAGDPVQVIVPAPERWELCAIDVTAPPGEDADAAFERLAREEAARPFDLARGPLFRATLLRLADDDHALLVNMHHVISDGWSLGVLFGELSALYGAFVRGEPSPLADLPVQYADYAVWQRRHLRGDALDAQVGYWRERLAGAPTLLELPTDRPRPAVKGYRGAGTEAVFPPAVRDGLNALARGEGATLYMVLLAAFQVLLSKYARQEDVVVGSPIAGRTRAEVEGLIGFFVNTLALRTDLSGDPSFREVLGRVRQTTLDAYAHQELPFEKLVEELNPARSLSHTPIFQVLFTLQNNRAAGRLRLAGVEARVAEGAPDTAKFDLALQMAESGAGLYAWLEYDADLFDAATADRMLAHLGVLLEAAAAHPERGIGALSLLTAEEHALLEAWNATESAYPAGSVQAEFARRAAAAPGAPAVTFGGRTLTYAELDRLSNRLAHRLAGAGVRPGDAVGVAAERSAEMVAALLGILKAGAAYVPLDPAFPAARLEGMMHDAGVGALVVRRDVPEALAGFGGPVVSFHRVDDEDDAPPAVDVSGEAPAYVMFTSGSTGRPKAVSVPHRGVMRLVRGTRFADFGPAEVFLQLSPLSFDASTLEIWGALLNGGRLVVAPPHTPSLPELAQTIREEGITSLFLTAALLQSAVDAELEALGSLRQLASGGDVLSLSHVRRIVEAHPGLRMLNAYGPTENTCLTTSLTVRPEHLRGASVPVGRPLANTRAYVVDAALRPCPVGVPGELLAAGDGLALGYLGRPGLTAEKFIPDPFSRRPGARAYRTGDLARWRGDGTLEFMGRLDRQVKVRGFRIEPGEIETALAADPAVRESVVVAREDTPGDRRLVAYVVGDGALDASALRARLRTALPDHMVPAAFVRLDALPLTSNGKLDRAALPAPEWAGSADAYVAPRTPREELLAGIWAEVLGVERVGVRDDFFDLGGHSLLATRVVSRVARETGAQMAVADLFRHHTIEALAALIPSVHAGAAPAESIVAQDGSAYLMDHLDTLSEDELDALLASMADGDPLE